MVKSSEGGDAWSGMVRLCDAAEVVEGSALRVGDGLHAVLLTRVDAEIKAWSVKCPHMDFPIQPAQGSKPLLRQRLFECHMHHALFRASDGVCVAGPCVGERLKMVRIEVLENEVWRQQ